MSEPSGNESRSSEASPDAARDAAPRPERAGPGPVKPVTTEALAEREWPVRPDGSVALATASQAGLPLWLAADEQFEAFRELRTRLLTLGEAAQREHFTTMVVPMTDACGGSFVTRNLAAAFTLQRRPSLVIECNFRSQADDEGFGPGRDAHGLFEFLSESEDPSAVLPIWPTVIRGLNVIPAGRRDPALAVLQREQLSSPAMKELMTKVRGWPCNTFLDAPPVTGSPDARILSDVADFVLLVVGYANATPRAIAKAAAMFEKKKFVGAVFNESGAVGARKSSA